MRYYCFPAIVFEVYFSCFLFIPGDEILNVNGESVQGFSHEEAIAVFKRIRSGPVVIRVAR